jgi:hypothetical protein
MRLCVALTGVVAFQSALAAAGVEDQPHSTAARLFYTLAPILFLTIFVTASWLWFDRRARRRLQLHEERVQREQQHASRVEEKLDRIIALLDSKDKNGT